MVEIATMEYSFRESAKKEEVRIVLNAYSMNITEGDEQTDLPYAFVTVVRIVRFKNSFGAILNFERGPTLTILNYTFDKSGNKLDQSRLYNTFLRVLHLHLQQKSNAEYISGKTNEKLFGICLVGLMLTLAAAFGAEYFGFALFYVRMLASLVLAFFMLMCWRHFFRPMQKKYQPDNIPLSFLPEN